MLVKAITATKKGQQPMIQMSVPTVLIYKSTYRSFKK